jgi:hypothetical protein
MNCHKNIEKKHEEDMAADLAALADCKETRIGAVRDNTKLGSNPTVNRKFRPKLKCAGMSEMQ